MPTTIPPNNLGRFVQLLRGYLTKTGRKQVELARYSNVSESLLSKVLKGKAQPTLANFYDFQAAFLVAHGGITQARQVAQMAGLLGGELDEAGLQRIANDVEEFKDPELDSLYFQDRAEAFRQTIPYALGSPEIGPSAEAPEPAELADDLATAGTDSTAEAALHELEGQPTASSDESLVVALAAWQALLRDVVQPVPADRLDPDEVVAAVLEWESQESNPRLASAVWEWIGPPEILEKLRQRERLVFVLRAVDGQKTWNQVEWEWLGHALAETARRQAGQPQLSPSQMLAFTTDLGQVAFEAIQADTEQGARLAVNLAHRPSRWPSGQPADWRWLIGVARSGPIRLSVSADGVCWFESREEAEFLAAQYLLNSDTDQVLVGVARNCGRPFGVLWQAVRSLHFAGQDETAAKLILELRHVSEDIPLRDADAVHLLAACEAPVSPSLKPIWKSMERELCFQWWSSSKAPEYRAYIARACRDQERTEFRLLILATVAEERDTGRVSDSALRSLAIIGGPDARGALLALAKKPVPTGAPRDSQELPWNPLAAALAVVPELPASEQVALLETLALSDAKHDQQWRAVSALAEVGSILAIRALERIAAKSADTKLGRYAETQRELLDSPAHLALVARELDTMAMDGDLTVVVPRVMTAIALLVRSVNVLPSVAPSRVLSRSLARLWARTDLSDEIRVQAAIGLRAAKAWPALEICLEALPLADQRDSRLAEWLLPDLASPAAAPLLWQLVDRAASPPQRVILIRCLGQAGGVALDERFGQLLADPAESVAAAAVAALAESLGAAAADRLAQIAAGDARPGVRTGANDGLAEIGSEQALPYLREKLTDPDRRAEACFQLARLHHPDAEAILVEAAKAVADESIRYRIYWPALAMSGGATAVQALRELLGPEPDEGALSQMRAQLLPETVSRAPNVWGQLADDPSPAWRQTAAAVLVRDPGQTLIERVVHMAVEDPDWPVRRLAQQRLRVDVPTIASVTVADYVLERLARRFSERGEPDAFLLELTHKCLSGLSMGRDELPPELARRAQAILQPMLRRAHPTFGFFYPLLDALAFPEFAETAAELERLLDMLTEPMAERRLLETLIAMQAPSLPTLLLQLARSDRRPSLQQQASDYLVEIIDWNGLARSPADLRFLGSRVAIRKGIRFQSGGFRHKVILPNGSPLRPDA